MNQGMTNDQFKDMLSNFTPDNSPAGASPVPSGFQISDEQKKQAKKYLKLTEQSLGMNRKPVHKVSREERPRRRRAKATKRVQSGFNEDVQVPQQQDLKELLHESVEMVASGTSPREMAIFLLEGGGRAKK